MDQHISTQQAVGAWKIAHRFVLDVYRLTNKLPREEHYGITPKMRTSSVKIASNIVEGYARKSNQFYLHHLSESEVALEETKYSLLVCRDLGYISDATYDRIMVDAEHLSEQLQGLHQQLAVEPGEQREPEAGREKETKLFGQRHGVRDEFAKLWRWLRGQKDTSNKPQVWVEEGPAYHYLDQGQADD